MAGKPKLTPKQQRFVQEYLIDLNATQAYRRAGYKVRSDNVAAVNADRLLRNAKIAAAIAEAKKQRAQRCALSADVVIQRLDRESRRLGNGATHMARVQALKLLGQHLGLFPKRVELTGRDGGPIAYSATDLSDDELARIIAEGEGSIS